MALSRYTLTRYLYTTSTGTVFDDPIQVISLGIGIQREIFSDPRVSESSRRVYHCTRPRFDGREIHTRDLRHSEFKLK